MGQKKLVSRSTLALLAVLAVAMLSACGAGNGGDDDFFRSRAASDGGNYGGGAKYAGGGRKNSGGGRAETAPSLTTSQKNALRTAEDYISMSGFSRSGLIDQLEFEGYSTKNAAFAVDHLNANWNEQAVRTAEDYLSMSGFSRSGLIAQLEFEGYTPTQAAYGADNAGVGGGANSGGVGAETGSSLTSSQKNALRTAENYISISGFSRSGLIGQLEFEGYSSKDAAFAVDHLNANWNEQAVRTAEDYLSISGFSRSGLIAQLEFDGYTPSQAEYGADKAL